MGHWSLCVAAGHCAAFASRLLSSFTAASPSFSSLNLCSELSQTAVLRVVLWNYGEDWKGSKLVLFLSQKQAHLYLFNKTSNLGSGCKLSGVV